MPQMSPLPWLMLMLFFIMMLLLISFQMFHTFTPHTPNISSDIQKSLKKNWMW